MISDTFSSTRHPRRSGWAPLSAPLVVLLLLVNAVLSLAIAHPAQAGAEVTPLAEPLGGPLVTPFVAPPPVVTDAATAVTQTSATLNATVNPEGAGVMKCEFEYGTSMAYGSVASCTPASLGTGTVPVAVSAPVAALSANTLYHFRISAENSGGASKGTDGSFNTLSNTPTVTSIAPASGPGAGGTKVTITGTNLGGAKEVKFGSALATIQGTSTETSVTATSPAGVGKVAVTVTTPAGTSATSTADEFTYVPAPVVTKVAPTHGPASGGTAVTITGSSFTGATEVRFGSTPATGVVVGSATSITATSPAGNGVVHVTVTTPAGTSATSTADEFTYAPTVTSIAPESGPETGGTAVTIKGRGFLTSSTVTIGGTAATEVKVLTEQEITARTPAGVAGPQKVVVNDAAGASTGGPEYLYVAGPTVTSITPSTGPPTGGTSVTIHGSGYLAGVQKVKFGSTVAPGTPVVNSEGTSMTVTSPAGTGTVNVTVTTLKGTSNISSADEFTYATTVVTPEGGTTTTGGGGGGGAGAGTGAATTGPPVHTSTGLLPGPVLARSADVNAIAGRVSIRLPGANSFVSLSSARQIPFGTVVEAVHGDVSVTAAKATGGTQMGQFFDGKFVLTQSGNGRVLGTLAGGNFSVCRPQAGAAAKRKVRSKYAASTHLVRRLWAESTGGSFSTQGRYAGGIVQGAQWLTEDMCQGTLILATRERVEVTDLVRHRHLQVPTGGIYLAKA